MFSKFGSISLGKLHVKMRSIGYKLGLVEFKTEDVELPKIPEIKIIGDYQYPHQHEEIVKDVREIHRKMDEAKGMYKSVG